MTGSGSFTSRVLRPGSRQETSAEAQAEVAPGWWVRQHDPDSSLYLPTPLAARNRVEAGWSLLSTLDGAGAASIDRRGAVVLPGATWMLDWWFNHDGTWQRAAAAAGVRQQRADGLPMAETRVRVGPNELVLRHGASPRRGASGGAWVTIEVEVDGPDPLGLALVSTPWTLTEVGRIDRVQVDNGVLSVNDQVALVGQRPPRAVYLAGVADELVELLATADPATDQAAADGVVSSSVDAPAGAGGVAMVWPMAHRSTLRLGLPIGPVDPPTAAWAAEAASELGRAPDLEAMAKGWDLHLGVGAVLDLPDATVTAMARAARAQLLAASDGAWFTGADAHDAAVAAGALARVGHPGQVAAVASEVARVVDDEPAGLAAVLEVTLGLGVTRTAEDVTVEPEELLVHLARTLHLIHRRLKRHGAAWWPDTDRPRLRSMVQVAEVLAEQWQQDGVADNARAIVALLPEPALPLEDLELGSAQTHETSSGLPSSGDASEDLELGSALAHETSSGLPSSGGSAEDAAIRWVRREPGADLDLPATLAAARRDIAAGRPSGALTVAAVASLLERLECWPDVVHPTRPLGVGEHGASIATMAQLLAAALDLAAPLRAGPVPAFAGFPPDWWGRPAQVSGLPVPGGTASCALRWHGARPALIWELSPTKDAPSNEAHGISLATPALDPSFSTTEISGESLLEMPPGAEELLAARAEAAAADAEAATERSDGQTEAAGDASTSAQAGEGETGVAPSGQGITMDVGIPTRRRPDGT